MGTRPSDVIALRTAIRERFGCPIKWSGSIGVDVGRNPAPPLPWNGTVELFELLEEHATQVCYAWTDCDSRMFAVLRTARVESPLAAVRASIARYDAARMQSGPDAARFVVDPIH